MGTLEIKTTGKEIILVSEKYYDIASKYKWCPRKERERIYPVTYLEGKRHYFGKLVLGLDKNQVIFYKNGNTFDFSDDNIIICTRKEFAHLNKHIEKSSKYVHVYYCNVKRRWGVKIIKDGQQIFGGRYLEEDEAAVAADYLSAVHYGPMANRNFPELSFKDIEKAYTELIQKYGDTVSEKVRKYNQGRSRNIVKTSNYIGVFWNKRADKWQSQIRKNKTNYHIGYFCDEVIAAEAYDKRALELYGESARLNFPNEIGEGSGDV